MTWMNNWKESFIVWGIIFFYLDDDLCCSAVTPALQYFSRRDMARDVPWIDCSSEMDSSFVTFPLHSSHSHEGGLLVSLNLSCDWYFFKTTQIRSILSLLFVASWKWKSCMQCLGRQLLSIFAFRSENTAKFVSICRYGLALRTRFREESFLQSIIRPKRCLFRGYLAVHIGQMLNGKQNLWRVWYGANAQEDTAWCLGSRSENVLSSVWRFLRTTESPCSRIHTVPRGQDRKQ